MEPEHPKRAASAAAVLVVLTGLSACMLAASVMTSVISLGWPLTIVALVVLVVSIYGLWVVYSKRDRRLY
jgi:uncharacterized membrane protein (DUF485 family)